MQPLPLTEVPLFAGLSDAAKAEIHSASALREYRAGDLILEPGAVGQFLFAISSGVVSVRSDSGRRERATVLGPGEVFGEMSLLSGTPVSAAVLAERESRIYVIPARTFDKLFAEEPAFRKGIADLLAERLRLRTSNKDRAPTCVLVGLTPSASRLRKVLARGIEHYAHVVELHCLGTGSEETNALGRDIDSWRASAHLGEICVASVPVRLIGELRNHMRPGDAVLLIDDGTASPELTVSAVWNMADVATVRIGGAACRPAQANLVWSYCLGEAEINAAHEPSEWSARATPVLDSIARWVARRSIGIALGSGAARGLAHLGVLGVLDAAGIPIDCLSGSSIGGIVALAYALSGSADGAYHLVRSAIGSNELIRDLSILPRSALFRGRKVRRSAERFSGGKHFSDLTRPALAVAADLITGELVVLDRGLLAPAFVATAAIPGVLPPVHSDERWLVDGALVSRVPVDLLGQYRCGLRIAVNTNTEVSEEGPSVHAELRRAMTRPFGLTRVILRSWELLGVLQGAAETQAADIVINAGTKQHSGYDFDAIDSFISAGRAAAERNLPDIRAAVQKLIQPRSP
jgi:NTE family protein